MREIKFRGKSGTKWLHGSLHVNESGQPAITTPANFVFCCVDPATVGQYTGLKDKDGKEIYEGDIVLYGNEMPTVVKWSDEDAYFIIKKSLILGHAYRYVRVIGNIHDDPELLEVKA